MQTVSKDKAVRRFFSQHSDLVFIGIVVLGFSGAALVAMNLSVFSMAGWETDFSNRSVHLDEVSDVPTTMEVTPINMPDFARVGGADWLDDDEPVIALDIEGEARAYPLSVLLRHQVVNDMVQERAVAVTYCPLCNSAIVYEREIDGEMLFFASSGKLRRSGFIMWDDVTESWWQQFTGNAIMGDYTGKMLEIVPSKVVSYGAYTAQYPDGWVLVGDESTPNMNYDTTLDVFTGYESSAAPPYLYESHDDRLDAMERVLAATIDGQPMAYPFSILAEDRVVNDEVKGVSVVAFWQPGAMSVLNVGRIDADRDVGMAVLFYRELPDGRTLNFYYESGKIRDDVTDSTWNIFGQATDGTLKGTYLAQVNCFPHFWFAWSATHPDTIIYSQTTS